MTGVTIAEASDALGLSADTLRYYEKDGLLLRPVPRTTSGHRQYDERDITWIRLVTRLRATGMPIRDVRRYAALVRAGQGNEEERLALLQAHREQVLREPGRGHRPPGGDRPQDRALHRLRPRAHGLTWSALQGVCWRT
ncbi:MerR family transcriptional regulator [Nocardioides convexus]|uniref:MerR family transcriptional regulator n=1 Tax=Nocardioides convexus TaxID=2712224 RepID=UPI002418BA12|nr:MerR family transcriptional regulator [Nocardioides convexus]